MKNYIILILAILTAIAGCNLRDNSIQGQVGDQISTSPPGGNSPPPSEGGFTPKNLQSLSKVGANVPSLTRGVTVASKTFFALATAAEGMELWVSDGTALGTYMIKDIKPGPEGSFPLWLTAHGTEVFFAADDGTNGYELWKSHGTEAGTVLVKDIAVGSASSDLGKFVSFNGVLVFLADDGVTGFDLWKSDGTTLGTSQLMDFTPDLSAIIGFTELSPTSLVILDGSRLTTTDGTPGGTAVQTTDISCYVLNEISNLPIIGGEAFFGCADFSPITGTELWKTDGTAGGTVMVKEIQAGGFNGVMPGTINGSPVNGGEFYFAGNNGSNGTELWKTDGTDPGTVIIRNIDNFSSFAGSTPKNFMYLGGNVLFSATTVTGGRELYKSGGTSGSTSRILDINPNGVNSNPEDFIIVNPGSGDRLLFTAHDGVNGREMWISDGTGGGTSMVKDIFPGATSSNPVILSSKNSPVIFAATDDVDGLSLWITEGTDPTTVKIKDVEDLPDQTLGIRIVNYNTIFDLGDKIVFVGENSDVGSEWYVTDGTPAGTKLLMDLLPGPDSGVIVSSFIPTLLNNKILFVGTSTKEDYDQLWITNGTVAGTSLLLDEETTPYYSGQFSYPLNNGSFVYWRGYHTTAKDEPFASDGTVGGSQMLADLKTGGIGNSQSRSIGKVNDKIIFSADGDGVGWELFTTDGTPGGTSLLMDINPGGGYSNASLGSYSFAEIGSLALFAAFDASTNTELYVTDGTPGGTSLLKDFNGAGNGSVNGLISYGSKAIFIADDGGPEGKDVWISDGTLAGTQLLKDLTTGGDTSLFPTSGIVNGNLVFIAFADYGKEFYYTDGTSANTGVLWDSAAGNMTITSPVITQLNSNKAFLSVTNLGSDPIVLTDGTPAGTKELNNISHLEAKEGKVVGDYFYFSKNCQLWRFEIDSEVFEQVSTNLGEKCYARILGILNNRMIIYNSSSSTAKDGEIKYIDF